MSSRTRRSKEEREENRALQPEQSPARPGGKVPQAIVLARHGTGMISRPGRGYSLGELSGVGLAPRTAIGWGVRIDPRRRSILEGNVNSLRTWQAHPTPKARAEGEVKKVEEEIKKVGREVEREVVVVTKEAAKVGKEVKKGAKKVEKAVKKRVKKPKTRPRKKKKS